MDKLLSFSELLKSFILLWSVIDPIGTIPVFLEATKHFPAKEKRDIAMRAPLIAGYILIFFIVAGEFLLQWMNISLPAFQISGGIVLFIFALTMVFGQAKPDSEIALIRDYKHVTVFPLAIPSIASPGAIMAVVLLTDNNRYSVFEQAQKTLVVVLILIITVFLLLAARRIQNLVGESGTTIISKIMGLIIASIAVESVLSGLKSYFGI